MFLRIFINAVTALLIIFSANSYSANLTQRPLLYGPIDSSEQRASHQCCTSRREACNTVWGTVIGGGGSVLGTYWVYWFMASAGETSLPHLGFLGLFGIAGGGALLGGTTSYLLNRFCCDTPYEEQ